jgi:hypothetical protein
VFDKSIVEDLVELKYFGSVEAVEVVEGLRLHLQIAHLFIIFLSFGIQALKKSLSLQYSI